MVLALGAAPVYGVSPYSVLGEESVVLGSVRIRGVLSWAMAVLAVAVGVGWVAAMCGVAAGAEQRRYELVSPSDKGGGEVMPYSSRTRAAGDGDAVGFGSLVGFGDVRGTGIAVEYLAQRRPELGRWVTHAITPTLPNVSLNSRAGAGDTNYEGDFSADFGRGLLVSVGRVSGVAGDGMVRDVPNLYRRDDLRTAGAGRYELLSGCPVCDASSTPLAPVSGIPGVLQQYLPRPAGASADLEHVTFESLQVLTSDTPAQSAFCGADNQFFPPPAPAFCAPHLYEWDHGQLRLAGVLPDGRPADASFAGTRAGFFTYTPHVVSDGRDGHSRIVFTQPTDSAGQTLSQLGPIDIFGQLFLLFSQSGNLFMREDHAQTVQLNASERTDCAGDPSCGGDDVPSPAPQPFAPAQYLEASADGTRIFFMTNQALTDSAQPGGFKIYMYDASKPASAPDNLTLVSSPTGDASSMVGVGADGHYAYYIGDGRFTTWHDGVSQDIGDVPLTLQNEQKTDGSNYGVTPRQSRVAPNGHFLLFTSDRPPTSIGYDHGHCQDPFGCRELYVYSADANKVVCASCNPTGAPATVDAKVPAAEFHGAAAVTSHLNRAVTDDGRVFFSTAEALVPQDTNGRSDAYEYDVDTGTLSLISTGTDSGGSFFVDASASGRDVFFATRERLIGWDRDNAYDLYDARIGGGLPGPPPTPPACSGGTCQGLRATPPAVSAPASAGFHGAGNARRVVRARSHRRACRRGYVRRSVRGKRKCVKRRVRHTRVERSGS
jgi:hypothetical protein